VVREQELDFSVEVLRNWKLVEHFQKILLPRLGAAAKQRTEQDPRRRLTAEGYFSLFLFRMFNPIITSMCGLCATTQFEKTRDICAHPVRPSSFSEAQHLFDGALLGQIVRDLAQECRSKAHFGDEAIRRAVQELTVVDGTVLRAVTRMSWAPAAGFGSAIRLHLHFSVFDQVPSDWSITPGNVAEPREWKKKIKPGEFYVVDRWYSHDLLYLKQLQKREIDFVARHCGNVIRTARAEPRPLTAEDRAAGVVSDRLEELGCLGGGPTLRVVEIHTAGKVFVLVTTRLDLPAHLIGLIYRYRWQIELYFKWLKTMLPCGHWLAESPEGVAIQIYCVMIASLLLLLWTGRRPTKREMEALWFYWSGFATDKELAQALAAQKKG
jgi:hypothetical protein